MLQHRLKEFKVYGYEFTGYYSQIDGIRAYYQANMELMDRNNRKALFNLDDPIYTKVRDEAPAKYGLESAVKNSIIADRFIINYVPAPTGYTVTPNAAGYATFSAAEATVIPDGATAYTGTISGEELVLNQIMGGYVPAGTGVIVAGTGGTPYNFAIHAGSVDAFLIQRLETGRCRGKAVDGTRQRLAFALFPARLYKCNGQICPIALTLFEVHVSANLKFQICANTFAPISKCRCRFRVFALTISPDFSVLISILAI